MKKSAIFFFFVGSWLFALSIQAQVIFSVRNEKLKMYTFTKLGVDNVRTRKNALVALTDSTFVVADSKELQTFIENWKSTHSGLLPSADSLQRLFSLRQIAFSDLKWAKINKPSGALIGLFLGGALGTILGAVSDDNKLFDRKDVMLVSVPLLMLIGAAIGALAQPQRKMYTETMTGFKERIQKWRKYTIVAQLQKIDPSLPK